MEINKFPMLIVGVVVALVLAGAVLPVFAETTNATSTFTNEGYYYMDRITAGQHDDIVIEYTKTPFKFTYNGAEIDVSKLDSSKQYTLVTNAQWVARFTSTSYVGLQGVGSGFSFGGPTTDHVVMTISNGTINVTAHGESDPPETVSTFTKTYTDLWVYSPIETDWLMKDTNTPAYMKTDSVFYAVGLTTISVWNDTVYITGTIDDWEATIVYPPNITTTTTNEVSVTSAVSNYKDLYELDKLTFTISDGTTSRDAVYSYFIVPSEVTAEKAVHPDGSLSVMLNVLPLLAIAGLVAGSVAWFITRK